MYENNEYDVLVIFEKIIVEDFVKELIELEKIIVLENMKEINKNDLVLEKIE